MFFLTTPLHPPRGRNGVGNGVAAWVVEWVKNGKMFKIDGGNGVGNEIPTSVNSRISYLNYGT